MIFEWLTNSVDHWIRSTKSIGVRTLDSSAHMLLNGVITHISLYFSIFLLSFNFILSSVPFPHLHSHPCDPSFHPFSSNSKNRTISNHNHPQTCPFPQLSSSPSLSVDHLHSSLHHRTKGWLQVRGKRGCTQ